MQVVANHLQAKQINPTENKMENKKLTLAYLFERKGKLAPGDVYEFGGREITVTKSDLDTVNIPMIKDSERFIRSFAMRVNVGLQPCSDDFPVFIEYYDCNDGEDDRRRGLASNFDYVKDGVKVWWPDIETLTKQQNEAAMQKLTSSEIDWQKNDVMIILEVGTNKELHRYSNAAHVEDSCVQYSVIRDIEFVEVVEAKTVRDAIIHYKAENSWDHIIYMDGKFKGCDFGEWGEYSVCTGKQFNAEVKAMSHFVGVHAFNDYIEYEDEVLEPEVLVYTHEAGTIFTGPGGGELCAVVSCSVTGQGDHIISYTYNDGCDIGVCWNNDTWFKPIETRTQAEIKIEEIAHYLNANKDTKTSDLAAELFAVFCGDSN